MAGPRRRPMTAAPSPGLRMSRSRTLAIAASFTRSLASTVRRRPAHCRASSATGDRTETAPMRGTTSAAAVFQRAQTWQPGAWGCRLAALSPSVTSAVPVAWTMSDGVRAARAGARFRRPGAYRVTLSGAVSAGSNPAGGHLPGDTAGGTRHCRGTTAGGTTPDLALWRLTCANRLGVILGVCSQMPRDVALRRVPGIYGAWPLGASGLATPGA